MLTKITSFLYCKTILFLLFFSNYALAQTTVTLDATLDNTLYEDTSKSNGIGPYLFAGRTNQGNNNKRRALLKFDIAATIPSGATITSVTLTMNVSKAKGGARDMNLHRVTKAWGEGTSNASGAGGKGATATTGDATWLESIKDSTSWTTAGGDFDTTSSATTSVNGPGSYTWSSAQMTVDAQSWLDSSAMALGWIVIGDESVLQTAKRFDSRENTTAANRPKLEITYSEPVSTKKVAQISPIKVYPNPAQKLVIIDRGTTNEAILELYDQQGRLLKQRNTIDALIEWNLEDVNAGMYMLKVTEADKIYMHKLLVQP